MERNPHDIKGPLHLVKCAVSLGVLAVKELVYNIDKALDAAWPDDSPEDADIHSDRWVSPSRHDDVA